MKQNDSILSKIIKNVAINIDKNEGNDAFLINAKGEYSHHFEINREQIETHYGFSFCWTVKNVANKYVINISTGIFISSYDEFKDIIGNVCEDALKYDVNALKEGCVVIADFFKQFKD